MEDGCTATAFTGKTTPHERWKEHTPRNLQPISSSLQIVRASTDTAEILDAWEILDFPMNKSKKFRRCSAH